MTTGGRSQHRPISLPAGNITVNSRAGITNTQANSVGSLYYCVYSQCSYVTPNPQFLSRHVNAHHTQVPKDAFRNHLQSQRKEANFSCQLCLSQFKSYTHLTEHIKNAHQRSDSYRIGGYTAHNSNVENARETTGGITFITAADPLQSQLAKSRESIPMMPHSDCDVCGAQFRSRRAMQEHIKGMHESRTFRCPCGKAFRWRTSLRIHTARCSVLQNPDAI